MLNCKDMTKLISDSLERKITLRERMELWMHIMMCGMCRRFRSNALALRRRVRGTALPSEDYQAAGPYTNSSETLSSSAKERIATTIKQQLG